MLVSIITVCYNSEKTIRETIESVLNQTYHEIEYIIVDGLSSDNTLKIAEEYRTQFAAKGMQLKIISEKDHGIYDAMNKGINNSCGEIVGIINSDDWYENNAVEVVVDTYKQQRFDYFYGDIRLIKSNGQAIIKHSKKDRLVTSRHWNHPTSFVTKETYAELGVFSCEGIHDDFDFFLRVRKAGKKIVIKNEILANFRTGGVSNDKSIEKSKKRVKDRYRCYRNNNYSRLYLIECLLIELAKNIVG